MKVRSVIFIVLISIISLCLGSCQKEGVISSTSKPLVIRLDGPVPRFKPPLYIVDNVKVTDIKQINPDSIVSINVVNMPQVDLIRTYGAKTKNGVVLVTTNKQK